MHVPDAFLDAPTSVATGAVAVAGVALSLRRSRGDLDDRVAPLAGLVATFVFAAQMINFPVAGGTSGHLLGGALAAVLVGPWTATLCVTVVLLVQALVFADGGLTALGTNITLMEEAAVFAGLFLVGGMAPVDAGGLFAAMIGWHLVIGIGEAVITGLVVSAVMGVRPDLVRGAEHLPRGGADVEAVAVR